LRNVYLIVSPLQLFHEPGAGLEIELFEMTLEEFLFGFAYLLYGLGFVLAEGYHQAETFPDQVQNRIFLTLNAKNVHEEAQQGDDLFAMTLNYVLFPHHQHESVTAAASCQLLQDVS
jgi:hypothetical protein